MKRLNRGFFGWVRTKRGLIAISLAGVLILSGAYALWSKLAWDEYGQEYAHTKEEIKKGLDIAMSQPSSSAKEHQGKIKALEAVKTDIGNRQRSLCTMPALLSWQQIIGGLKKQTEECQGAKEAIQKLGDNLGALIAYLKDESALSSLLAQLPADKTEVAEDTWKTKAAAWHAASEKVAKLKVQQTFKTVKEAAVTALQKIDTAWQAVITAHEAKDEAKYEKARTELVQSYGGIGGVSDAGAGQFKQLIREYQSSYTDLYQ